MTKRSQVLEVLILVAMKGVLAEEKKRSHVEEVLALEVARYKTRKRESGFGVSGWCMRTRQEGTKAVKKRSSLKICRTEQRLGAAVDDGPHVDTRPCTSHHDGVNFCTEPTRRTAHVAS